MLYSGMALVASSAFGLFFEASEVLNVVIGLLFVITAAAFPIILTEKELRSRFLKKGS
jgi:hypothetical protein